MRRARLSTLLPATVLLFSGCAFTRESIRLEPPTLVTSAVAGAEAIAVQVTVHDFRPNQDDVVAWKINGWGHQGAPISSETPVPEVLAGALTNGLKGRGYRVTADAPAVLLVELFVFSHEFRTGFWHGQSEAQVTFLATVRDRGGRELFRQVVTEPFSHPIQLASGANVKKAYEAALGAAVERLVTWEGLHQALAATVAPPVL